MSEDRITLQAQFLRDPFGILMSTGPADRRVYHCRFVRAGKIKAAGNRESNVMIEPSALQLAAGARLFEAKAVFIDHPGWFEHPSIHNLAGVTSNSRWNEQTSSVDGDITLYSGAQDIAQLLDELMGEGTTAPDVGLSIVFWPVWAPRDNPDDPRRIIDIRHVESVDIVFEPAADGRILQALSALSFSGTDTAHPMKEVLQMSDKPLNQGAASQRFAESPAAPTNDGEAWQAALASTAATMIIQQSDLPKVSKDKLILGSYKTPEDVQTAIRKEHEYLAALTQDSVIQIGGTAPRGGQISVGLEPLEKLTLALEALVAGENPGKDVAPLSGIREAYIHLSGDYEMTGVFNPDRIQFATVNSSTMAGLVANALNKRVVNLFQQYPHWWEKFCSVEDFATLQAVKWITLGGVGELPTVAEGAAYTELTWDDQTETASFVKKGGYLGITLEAIDKDDTRRLQAAPRALAQAAWLTLAKAISYIFTQSSGVGPTLSDSVALFDAGHLNLISSALSITTWTAARLAMRKQTELNSAERLGSLTAPKFLLVPPDLEVTALQVLAAESDYLYALSNGQAAPPNVHAEGDSFNARMLSAKERVIVIDLWTDTTDWAAVADPMFYPTIGIGFRYGRQPEIYSVASPTAGLMFSNDTMPIKARFFFAVGPMDYRGLYKANV